MLPRLPHHYTNDSMPDSDNKRQPERGSALQLNPLAVNFIRNVLIPKIYPLEPGQGRSFQRLYDDFAKAKGGTSTAAAKLWQRRFSDSTIGDDELYFLSQKLGTDNESLYRTLVSLSRQWIESEDFFRLSAEAQAHLFQIWRGEKARYEPPPQIPAATPKTQERLQSEFPIRFELFDELFSLIGLPIRFKCPLGPSAFVEWEKAASNVEGEFLPALTSRAGNAPVSDALKSVTGYLGEEDVITDPADIAFVPGYRSTLRAEKAAELFFSGKVKKIYLSGRKPLYAKNEDVPISEATALTYHLITARGVPKEAIIADERGLSTNENVHLSSRELAIRAGQASRPLSFILVCSPYHMRRTFLHFQHAARRNPNIFGAIRRCASSTRPELAPDNWFTNTLGVAAYWMEMRKLYRGRITGEF